VLPIRAALRALAVGGPLLLAAPAAEAQTRTDCSAYHFTGAPLTEAEFLEFDHGTISVGGLTCLVRQRGVAFRPSASVVEDINKPFEQPELEAAVRESFRGTSRAAAAATPAARTAGVPTGVYACGNTSMTGRFVPYGDTRIGDGGAYAVDAQRGSFALDAGSGRITWRGGPHARAGWTGRYYAPGVGGMDVPTFTVLDAGGRQVMSCKRRDG
jgi:hypothetical protein